MVSVCMSVKNGAKYLEEQVESILPQLSAIDELIACDDCSTDKSVSILKSFQDRRIKIIHGPGRGVISSVEHALRHSTGDLVFLSDQDDVWSRNKIGVMSEHLHDYDLVVCDCALIDNGQNESKSFFQLNRSGKGLLKNLIHNSYMGCCMAFRREVLDYALPFPEGIAMHDYWIGLVAELRYKTLFLHEPLVFHRKHASNLSTTGRKSAQPYSKRISQRIHLLKNLVQRAHV